MAIATEARRERAGEEGLPPISGADLDPTLLQLGLLVGLLVDAGDGKYEIDMGWFASPWTNGIAKIPSERAGELLALLESLVGSAAPGAIGQPHQEDGMLWYPLAIPGVSGGTDDSPLFLVGPAPGAPDPVVLGVGVRYSTTVERVGFAAYAYLPLIELGAASEPRLVLGSGLPSEPAHAGIEITGANLTAGDVQLGGLQFRAAVELAGGAPELDLVFLQLRLPGQAAASDQTLADLRELGADEWIATALSVLVAEVASLLPANEGTTLETMLGSALGLLGITTDLPAPPWQEVLADPQGALLDWAGQLASSDARLQQWLALLAGVLDPGATTVADGTGRRADSYLSAAATGAPPAVTGTGTRTDPYVVTVVEVGPVMVGMTLGTEVDSGGARHVYPGIVASAQPPSPSQLPQVALVLAVATELADLVVPTSAMRRAGALPVHLPLASLDFTATLRNADETRPLISVADPAFTLGSGVAGIRFSGADQTLSPVFELVDVTSTLGSWPLVELSSVDDVVKQAEGALTAIVQQAIERFVGGSELAVVLGVEAPPGLPAPWPVPLLFDGTPGIEGVVADPLGALGAYYSRALAAADLGSTPATAPIAYLLSSLAQLVGGPAAPPQGSGTRLDPWRAPLLETGGLTASLCAWSPGANELRLGVVAGFDLDFTATTLTTEIELELVGLTLPAGDGTGAGAATWAAGVRAAIALGGTLAVPAVGGVGLSATAVELSGGWADSTGWYGLLDIEGATLTSAGVEVALDLPPFDVDPGAWTQQDFAELTTAAVNLIGLWLLEHGGRTGVTLTTVFGLLPDLPAVFATENPPFPVPADFTLPSPWPTLTIGDAPTFFTDPWHDLRAQLAAVLGTPATGEAATALAGWALTGTAAPKPAAGTGDDPFTAPLADRVELLVWTVPEASGPGVGAIGLGVAAAASTQTVAEVELTVAVRADLVTVPVAGATADPPVPALDLLAVFTNPTAGQPLLDDQTTGVVIGSAVLGASVSGAGMAPVATFLDSSPASGVDLGTVDVDQALASSLGMQRLSTLVGALFGLLPSTAQESSPLASALAILEQLELVGSGGVRTASWTALLADAEGYVGDELTRILADDASEAAFFASVAQLLGVTPTAPEPALRCLAAVAAAFDLCVPSASGPVPSPRALLEALSNPLAFAGRAAPALFGDTQAVQRLVTALGGLAQSGPMPLPFAGLVVTVDNATAVTLATPAAALGSEVTVSGALTLDLTGGRIAGQATVASATAGVAVGAVAGVELAGNASVGNPPADGVAGVTAATTSWEVDLAAPPDSRTPAAFAPIRLAGSAGGIDPQAVAVAVPTFVLSALTAALLNGFVLPNSPLASRIVVALGLASGQPARVPSVAGAIMHPQAWLESVLGDDLAKLGPLIAAVAGGGVDGPGGIELSAVDDSGLEATGLPFGTAVTLTATADGLTLAATVSETVDGVTLSLAPTLTYDPPTGIAAGGTATLGMAIGGAPFAIAAGYQASSFSLSVTAQGATFVLVPFSGLNQYVEGATTVLLTYVVDEALTAYQAMSSPPAGLVAVVDALQAVAQAVGIASVADLESAAKAIVADPLAWLNGLTADAEKIAAAIASLLQTTFGLQGVSATGGQVTYAPSLGTVGTLAVTLGWDAHGNLGVSLAPTLTPSPLALKATVGASVATPISTEPAFELTVGGSLALDATAVPGLPLPGSPALTGALDVSGQGTTFQLALYPCGDPASPPKPLPMLELLPSFGLQSTAGASVSLEDWLLDAAFGFAMPVLGSAALEVPVVKTWLTAAIPGAPSGTTAASILAGIGVLGSATPPFAVADPRTVFDVDPETAVVKVLAAALQALDGVNLLPASIGGSAKIVGAGTPPVYGLEVAIPGITIVESPHVVLQLGAWPTGDAAPYWIASSLSTAPQAAAPGITADLLTIPSGGAPQLTPSLAIVSVGVDVTGAGNKPLVDVAGVQLGGVEARAYAALDGQWYGGAAIRVDDLALPLGPQLGADAGSQNPVAEDLLSSTPDQGGEGPGKPVNPDLSALAAKVLPGGTLDVTLIGNQPGDTDSHVTVPVQRALGPLYCQDVTIDWDDPTSVLGVGFDGSVELAGLSVGVVGLEVDVPIATPQDRSKYGLQLTGLDVAFAGGPVTLNGGLYEAGTSPVIYNGTLAVQAEQFGLGVLGSYTTIQIGNESRPSMFAFGWLNAPIGGPPFFYVTGLAAGFGYNGALVLPSQDEVTTFPLVTAIESPPPNPAAALTALRRWIPPQAGEYWLAAGVQFTTFELLDSSALLACQFGAEFTLALLGTSTLVVPSQASDEIPAIAKATLALEAVFKPSAGTFSMSAVLTPDSYVLDPNAHLTGGFAFDVWWAGEHEGQFVLTVGGYSPRFEVPDYYPQEQRLGLNWALGSDVQIVGGAYFALTPSAVMAGGELSLTYQAGNLKAWLDASADVLVRWKPFGFSVGISISIGASYRVDAWFVHHTFSIELGATLDLHGMPIGGRVGVHWYIISFSIDFGHTSRPAPALSWQQFADSFLPAQDAVVRAAVADGLVKSLDADNTQWVLAQRFTLVTSSVIPSTAATFNGTAPAGSWNEAIGVRPMQAASADSAHTITLTDSSGNDVTDLLQVSATTGNLPAALWSPDPQPQATPSNELVTDALTGLQIVGTSEPVVSLSPFPLSRLVETTTMKATWAPPARPPSHAYPDQGVVEQIEAALNQPAVAAARTAIVAALAPTFPELVDGTPAVLARFADQALQAAPTLVPLGAQPEGAPA